VSCIMFGGGIQCWNSHPRCIKKLFKHRQEQMSRYFQRTWSLFNISTLFYPEPGNHFGLMSKYLYRTGCCPDQRQGGDQSISRGEKSKVKNTFINYLPTLNVATVLLVPLLLVLPSPLSAYISPFHISSLSSLSILFISTYPQPNLNHLLVIQTLAHVDDILYGYTSLPTPSEVNFFGLKAIGALYRNSFSTMGPRLLMRPAKGRPQLQPATTAVPKPVPEPAPKPKGKAVAAVESAKPIQDVLLTQQHSFELVKIGINVAVSTFSPEAPLHTLLSAD
jgi:hypothetical protein